MTIKRPMFPSRADNVVAFPSEAKQHRFASRTYTRREGNMHTFKFRSYSAILEADEDDLIRDVGCDMHKARSNSGRSSSA
jgi:hypothetical protein